ncbi:MAG: hypothetical protein HYY36_08210, partial [Gammaproteobacteria bacterium]|nr:hypothetical protein [Gammaproteobacteria bacterium]
IQRMTQLCTLFVLLGLLGFLAGRRLCELRRPRQGYALMSIAIAAGTFLAVLSKENGVLLPLLALIMDVTLLAGAPAIAGYARWRAVFLILPSILILSLLIGHIPEAARSFNLRPYSMYQKTLTEAVVLFQYLGNLFLPRPDAFGLYHDDFPISLGILDPPHTLAAVLGAAGLLAAAILARRKAPVAAFAMLWFFAGHLIESSFLNLAIYFEHRNYLPSAGIAFLIAWTGAGPGISAGTERFLRAGLTVFIVLLALASLANAKLWRDHLDLAEQAVRTHPRSPWALTSLGNSYLRKARLAEAGRLYAYIAEQFPGEIYPQIKEAAVAACILNRAPPDAWWEGVIAQGRSAAPAGFDQVAELSGLISAIIGGECQALDQGRLLQLIEALAENPDFRRETGALHDLAGNLCLHRRDWGRAYRHLSESVRALPTVERRLHLIDLQLAMKKQGEALDEANRLEQDLRSRPVAWLGYRNQIRTLRERIHALQETD